MHAYRRDASAWFGLGVELATDGCPVAAARSLGRSAALAAVAGDGRHRGAALCNYARLLSAAPGGRPHAVPVYRAALSAVLPPVLVGASADGPHAFLAHLGLATALQSGAEAAAHFSKAAVLGAADPALMRSLTLKQQTSLLAVAAAASSLPPGPESTESPLARGAHAVNHAGAGLAGSLYRAPANDLAGDL